jgi:hypothetical protein
MSDDHNSHQFTLPDVPEPPDKVFALATPAHMLDKLYWEIRELKRALAEPPARIRDTHAPSYHAFNCAVTAWHLVDWCWEAASESLRQDMARAFGRSVDIGAFKEGLTQKYRPLRICQQIANGSKHMTLRRPDPTVRASTVWQYVAPLSGRMRAGQPLGRYEYKLVIFDNDVERSAVEVFEQAFQCWHRLLGEWWFIEGHLVTGSPVT